MARFKFKDLTSPERNFYLAEAGFTDRQIEVFNLKCRGWGRIQICDKLAMAESVVSCEVRDILEKMRRCRLQCSKTEYANIIENMPPWTSANSNPIN